MNNLLFFQRKHSMISPSTTQNCNTIKCNYTHEPDPVWEEPSFRSFCFAFFFTQTSVRYYRINNSHFFNTCSSSVHVVPQWFSTGANVAPHRWNLPKSEEMFDCHTGRRVNIGIYWVEANEVTTHPTIYKTILHHRELPKMSIQPKSRNTALRSSNNWIHSLLCIHSLISSISVNIQTASEIWMALTPVHLLITPRLDHIFLCSLRNSTT